MMRELRIWLLEARVGERESEEEERGCGGGKGERGKADGMGGRDEGEGEGGRGERGVGRGEGEGASLRRGGFKSFTCTCEGLDAPQASRASTSVEEAPRASKLFLLKKLACPPLTSDVHTLVGDDEEVEGEEEDG